MEEKKEIDLFELGYFDVSWHDAYSPTDYRRWCEKGHLGSLYKGSVIAEVCVSAPCGSSKISVIDSLIAELQKYKEGLKDE